MALNWQNIPISLAKGIDTKTDFKQVVPGKLLTLENGVFISPEEITKRNGHLLLPLGLSSGSLLASYHNELIALDGTSLYSYSQELQSATNKGPVTSTEVTLTSVVKNAFTQTGIDGAWSSTGLQCVTWSEDYAGVGQSKYSIIDAVTGDNIVYAKAMPLGTNGGILLKPLAFGNYFIIVYYQAAVSPTINYMAIPLATPDTPNAPVVIASNLTTSSRVFDACIIANRLFVTWENNNGTPGISLKYLTTSLVLSSESQYTGATNISYLTAWSDTVLQQVWVSYATTAPLIGYLIVDFNLSATPVLAATTIDASPGNPVTRIIGEAVNGSGNVWYTPQANGDADIVQINTTPLNNTGTGISPVLFLQSVVLVGKVFRYNLVNYIPIGFLGVNRGALQSTYFIVNGGGVVVAKILPDVAGIVFNATLLPEVTSQITGKYMLPVEQTYILESVPGTQVKTQSGASLSFINFLSNDTYYKSVVGNNLNISGGVLECYDGQNIVEQNFNLFPEIIGAMQSNTGGHLGNGSVATNYAYIVTYEWTDNQGQIQRSTTSIPNDSVSFGSGVTTGQVVLTITTLTLTQKSNVLITIYRTQGNGTIFHQITSNFFIQSPLTSPFFNDPTVFSLTYTDNASDASIAGNNILYTTGGVVDNAAVPASSYITPYQDKLIAIPSENKNQFWYTKSIVPGTPPEFSQSFIWNVDTRGGDLTGAQQLDDKLILFKHDNLLYMTGQGPSDTGANNDFTEAQILPFDVGCSNAHSIISYEDGLIFQSSKGIFKLNRGLILSYIGADVEAFNNNLITSASIVPNTTQLRFTLDNGVTLTYDYFVQQWSVFTGINGKSSTIFEELFTYIEPTGNVLQETLGSFTDNGSFIKLKLVTSWLSFAKLQGFQRMKSLYILGDYISPHSLIVKVAYDFQSSFTQTNTIPVTANPSALGLPYEWRVDLQQQKSTAIQFSVEDSQTMPFGAGMNLSNFSFMAGLKQGLNKLPPSQIYA